jgi:hypothetical protein
MKSIYKITFLLLIVAGITGLIVSCKKDHNSATPSISYVRVTNPQSSDSLLIGAGQGALIAIVGSNLQNVVQIWFNDQQALLTPSYITSTSIIVRVPSQIPQKITDTMKLIFSDGYILNHKFKVQISKPFINSMLSEFVNNGDVATIFGNYFYAPLTVTFTGGAVAEIVSIKDQQLDFKVPVGAQPGSITIKTNFGQAISDFMFRDPRPKVIDADPAEGWWGTYLVTNPGPNDPPKISGNYYRFIKQVKAWTWDQPEVAGGPADANPVHSKNVPDGAILKPEDYNLKFEINTVKPYNSNNIGINVGLTAEDNNNYSWKPPYDSKGKWNTITVPFEDVVRSYTNKPVVSPSGYWTRILVFGPGDLDADIAFDNLRVVLKKQP